MGFRLRTGLGLAGVPGRGRRRRSRATRCDAAPIPAAEPPSISELEEQAATDLRHVLAEADDELLAEAFSEYDAPDLRRSPGTAIDCVLRMYRELYGDTRLAMSTAADESRRLRSTVDARTIYAHTQRRAAEWEAQVVAHAAAWAASTVD